MSPMLMPDDAQRLLDRPRIDSTSRTAIPRRIDDEPRQVAAVPDAALPAERIAQATADRALDTRVRDLVPHASSRARVNGEPVE